MKPENENKKISLIEKDGLAVEIVGCPDEHGFVFAGPLAPETVLSVSEFLTAVDAIRSRIQRMPYVMKNAIVKFPFSVVIHSADTALDLDIIISPLRPARNALLRAIREYFSDNTIRSSRTFALLDMLEKAIGKPVKVDVKTKIRLVDAPFSFDDDNREYLPDEFFALLNRVKGYISEDFASSFTIQTELKCDAFLLVSLFWHFQRFRCRLCLKYVFLVVVLVNLHEYAGKGEKSYTVRNTPES